jgi:hypothetical protein
VWGGPNAHYSLTRARENFRDHFSQYDTDDPMSQRYSVRAIEAKKAMAAAFEEMNNDLSIEIHDEMWRRVLASEQTLYQESTKRTSDREWMRQQSERQWAYWERLHGTEWVKDKRRRIELFRQRMDASRAKRESSRQTNTLRDDK